MKILKCYENNINPTLMLMRYSTAVISPRKNSQIYNNLEKKIKKNSNNNI
jgi:hypothetical protein